MKQSGTKNVPSFYRLRKVQGSISGLFFNPEKHHSIKGTEFWMNNPIETLRLVGKFVCVMCLSLS
jgi:hypothetical protein